MLKAEEVPRADDGPALLKLMMKFSAHGMEAGFVWKKTNAQAHSGLKIALSNFQREMPAL